MSSGSRSTGQAGGLDIVAGEVLAEKLATLEISGRRVEAALAALSAHAGQEAEREGLVDAAAEAVWMFFIQRELMGLRDQKAVVAQYKIPGAVLARLGVRPRRRPDQ